LIRCAQCWQEKTPAEFIGARGKPVQRCAECRDKYRNWKPGNRASEPRRGLPMHRPAPRVLWNRRSGNAKLGPIPAAIVSGETCPPSCGFYGKGCFAEFGPLGAHWRRTADDGLDWQALLDAVRALPEGQLWRYGVAGDLPGNGDTLDVELLAELVKAQRGRRGFAFTHKPLTTELERSFIRFANYYGFTVNLSADTLAQADERAALGVGPVVVVLPRGTAGDVRTPAGRRVVICPAETRGLDCSRCGLCSRSERKGIVGFLAHGQMHQTVSRIASGGSRET